MVQKKVCLLGAFAVGKTSLVKQFITGMFSETYLTTIGVTIEKKLMTVEEAPLTLIIWDIYGEDEFQTLRTSYLRGANGCIFVVDGTRRDTLEKACDLHHLVDEFLGPVPVVFVINKFDLIDQWEIAASSIDTLQSQGRSVFRTSAKTGEGVEEAFANLAEKMLSITTF